MRPPRVLHLTTVDLTPRFILLGLFRRLRADGFDVTFMCAPGPWAEEVRDEGFHFIPWGHATRSWEPTEMR